MLKPTPNTNVHIPCCFYHLFAKYRNEVLPLYGNTHTTTSVTSLQTTLFRHEARDIFRNATNAAEEDAVIFTGSGTTAAVHKLINGLGLREVNCQYYKW